MLLQALRRVEAGGVRETVHSIHQSCGQVFRYGVSTGRCERNPAADLRGALRPVLVKHMAAVTEPKEFGDLLRAIYDYQGSPVTRAALQNAASIAGLLLTTECLVTEVPAEEKSDSAPGGQGGMDY